MSSSKKNHAGEVDRAVDNTDPRMAQLEQDRDTPFTETQRAQLPRQLRELDQGLQTARKFPLTDGGIEPSILFRPVRPSRP